MAFFEGLWFGCITESQVGSCRGPQGEERRGWGPSAVLAVRMEAVFTQDSNGSVRVCPGEGTLSLSPSAPRTEEGQISKPGS